MLLHPDRKTPGIQVVMFIDQVIFKSFSSPN